jgi:pSer/pThr/pTyr-binding forkhead associated (FHA) protein
MAKLKIKSRGRGIKEIVLRADKDLTIGRDQSNDLVLDNPAVSRNHARIYKTQWPFYIEDLNSANGTFLNGVKMEFPMPLNNNDIITISKHEIVFNDSPSDYDSGKGRPFNPDATIKV